VDQNNQVLGQHEGAIFYTIGQRHGVGVGAGLPYYVVGQDMTKNEVYVTTDLSDQRLWHTTINLTDVHWINDVPENGLELHVRTRHRAPLVKGILKTKDGKVSVELKDEIRAL